jgi:hypothetical protein
MSAGISDLRDLGSVAGVPVGVWSNTFRHVYSTTEIGVLFNGWPDGGPLDEQEQVLLEVLDIMRDEAKAILQELKGQA